MSIWECCNEQPKHDLEPCGCLPPGFNRLRYFFGKHLSVADFMDEQRYHIAKQRFHTQRLHGTGILCGLNVSLLEAEGTLIRVSKGAALDPCGREIVVGYDQCLDVNAWYQQELKRRHEENQKWPDGFLNDDGSLPLCIVLRYTECPTNPEPAPRDPCSCAEGGCEYGRVREQFELRVMVENEAKAVTSHDLFPNREQIAEAQADAMSGGDLLRRLAQTLAEGCPPAPEDLWITLGCFSAKFDAQDPLKVSSIDINVQGAAPILLSTEVIQHLVAQLYQHSPVIAGAPTVTEIEWVPSQQAPYQLALFLSGEVEPSTVAIDERFKLRKFIPGTGWVSPNENLASEFNNNFNGHAAILIEIDNSNNFIENGGRYQLYLNTSLDPIVDSELRPLSPKDLVVTFQIVDPSGVGTFEMKLPPFTSNP